MSWYVIKTKPYKTLKAKLFFDTLDVESFIPCYGILSNQINSGRPIITGYVFVRFYQVLNYTLINQNPFTSDVLKNGITPIEIPDQQMELMINHIKSLYKKKDFHKYLPGDIIEISHGVFTGVKGKVIEIKKNKIYLYLNASLSKLSLALT